MLCQADMIRRSTVTVKLANSSALTGVNALGTAMAMAKLLVVILMHHDVYVTIKKALYYMKTFVNVMMYAGSNLMAMVAVTALTVIMRTLVAIAP